MENNRGVVSEDTVEELKVIQKGFIKVCNDFKAALQPAICNVRSGEANVDSISELLQNYIDNEYSPENIDLKMNGFESEIKRIDTIKEMEEYASTKEIDFRFISKEYLLSLTDQIGKCFIMYMDLENKDQKTMDYFQKLMNVPQSCLERNKPKYIWADCPREGHDGEETMNMIEERRDGVITFDNLLTCNKECFVRIPQMAQQFCQRRDAPRQRVPLRIKCPSSIR